MFFALYLFRSVSASLFDSGPSFSVPPFQLHALLSALSVSLSNNVERLMAASTLSLISLKMSLREALENASELCAHANGWHNNFQGTLRFTMRTRIPLDWFGILKHILVWRHGREGS